jgi:CO dehydrogenase/acetyl-CoA synthase beta subunit
VEKGIEEEEDEEEEDEEEEDEEEEELQPTCRRKSLEMHRTDEKGSNQINDNIDK